MNPETTQDVSAPFDIPAGAADAGVGSRLRQARQALGWSVEDTAARLRTSVRIVQAMEDEDWSRLGAPVYLRSHLGNYARLLELPPSAVEPVLARGEHAPPALVSLGRSSRLRHTVEQLARRGVYIVLTVSIVGSVVWLATSGRLPEGQIALAPLDVSPSAAPATGPTVVQTAPPPAPASDPPPVTASLSPFYGKQRAEDVAVPTPLQTAAASTPALVGGVLLQVREDSWVEVFGTDGQKLESALLKAGTERRYDVAQVARITLGNADAVDVQLNGGPLDLTPFRRANVARFTLSSDGRAVPAGG